MSLMGHATKIGIVTATIAAMTVDLVGPAGIFGRLDIPVFKMGSFGGEIRVLNQVVRIIDMRAFKAFVKSIMQDEDLVLRLENGVTTVRAAGMTAKIVYKKDLHLKGLTGLTSMLIQAKQIGGEMKSTFCISNPSPFEIDLGIVHYQIQDERGNAIGEQRGETYIMRGGESYLMVTGHITTKLTCGWARCIGLAVEHDTWVKEIIGLVDITASIPSDFKAWHV